MIGIGKDDFCAELFESFLGEALDGRLGAHGHEEGSFNCAMRRGQAAAARVRRVGLRYFKRKVHLPLTPESRTGKNACPTSVYQEKINAQPTRQATNAAQTPKAMVYVWEPFSFFGFTAANPTANKIRVQN